jgi:hypothetical protein
VNSGGWGNEGCGLPISVGEDWKQRLYHELRKADTVIGRSSDRYRYTDAVSNLESDTFGGGRVEPGRVGGFRRIW